MAQSSACLPSVRINGAVTIRTQYVFILASPMADTDDGALSDAAVRARMVVRVRTGQHGLIEIGVSLRPHAQYRGEEVLNWFLSRTRVLGEGMTRRSRDEMFQSAAAVLHVRSDGELYNSSRSQQ